MHETGGTLGSPAGMRTIALAEVTSSGTPLLARVRLRSSSPLAAALGNPSPMAGTAPGAVSGNDGDGGSGGNSVAMRDTDSKVSKGRSKRVIDLEEAPAAKRTRSWSSEASGGGGDRDVDGGCDGSSTGRGRSGGSEDRCVASSRLSGGRLKRTFDAGEGEALPTKRPCSLSGRSREGGNGYTDSGGGIDGHLDGGSESSTSSGVDSGGGIAGYSEGGIDGGTSGTGVDSGGGIGGDFEGRKDGVIGGVDSVGGIGGGFEAGSNGCTSSGVDSGGDIGGDFEGRSDGVIGGSGVDSGGDVVGLFEGGSDVGTSGVVGVSGIVGHFEVESDGVTGASGIDSGGGIVGDFDGGSDGGTGSAGGSDCVPPFPPVHTRIGTTTYFSSSFVASTMAAKPLESPPPQLDEGQLPECPHTHGAGDFGVRSFFEQSPAMGCYRRDILKPSPLGNVAENNDSGGKNSHVMEHPLGGGLRASGSWDGGSASDAPPGGGGGFRALPASCDGDGNDGNGSNPGEGDDPETKSSACEVPQPLSLDCVSPTPSQWEGGPDSLWGSSDERRSIDDMFSDPLLSKMLLASPNSLDLQQAGSVRDFGGLGGAGNAAEGLSFAFSDLPDTNMADCMASLQGNPELASSAGGVAFQWTSESPLQMPTAENAGAARHDDDGGVEGRTVEHVELSGSDSVGRGAANMAAEDVEPGGRGCARGRIGDDDQAAIPHLGPRGDMTSEQAQPGSRGDEGRFGVDTTADHAELSDIGGIGGVAANTAAEDLESGCKGSAQGRIRDDYQAVVPDLMCHVDTTDEHAQHGLRSGAGGYGVHMTAKNTEHSDSGSVGGFAAAEDVKPGGKGSARGRIGGDYQPVIPDLMCRVGGSGVGAWAATLDSDTRVDTTDEHAQHGLRSGAGGYGVHMTAKNTEHGDSGSVGGFAAAEDVKPGGKGSARGRIGGDYQPVIPDLMCRVGGSGVGAWAATLDSDTRVDTTDEHAQHGLRSGAGGYGVHMTAKNTEHSDSGSVGGFAAAEDVKPGGKGSARGRIGGDYQPVIPDLMCRVGGSGVGAWAATLDSDTRVDTTDEHAQHGLRSGAGGYGVHMTAKNTEHSDSGSVGGFAAAEDVKPGGKGSARGRIGGDYQAVIPDLMCRVGGSGVGAWAATLDSDTRVDKTAEHTKPGGRSGAGGCGVDMIAELAELDGCCGAGGFAINMAEDALFGGRGNTGARVGDDYQAVIPDLMYHVGNRTSEKSCREPPLKLWQPGIVPECALPLAFPPPRRNGAGSADMEHKMLSAYLISKAGENADAEDLEALGRVVDAGQGCAWKSDWPEEDREAFRKGIHAFRRDFTRVRASFLPHRTVDEIVDYFYGRWKKDPGYRAWKDTKMLIGRRVAKRVDFSPTRRRDEGGKCLDILSHCVRRGHVVRKEFMGNDEVFTVRFPRNGSFPEKTEVVNIGRLEMMIVDGWASDEDKEYNDHEDTTCSASCGTRDEV